MRNITKSLTTVDTEERRAHEACDGRTRVFRDGYPGSRAFAVFLRYSVSSVVVFFWKGAPNAAARYPSIA